MQVRGQRVSGNAMARKSKMSVLKRQRERKKAEKAAMKRETRGQKRRRGRIQEVNGAPESIQGHQ
jgi:hypothetical protein